MAQALSSFPEMDPVEAAIRDAEDGRFEGAAPVLSAAIAGTTRLHSYHDLSAAFSFYGLCVANLHGDFKRATEYCEHAIRLEPDVGRYYVNLAKVFVRAGNRRKALAVLDKGLRRLPGDPAIDGFRQSFGYRRRAVLPFLRRRHPLNRFLGRLRYRIFS